MFGLFKILPNIIHHVMSELAIFGVEHSLPVLFPDKVAKTICFGSVNENGALVEAAAVCANNNFIGLSDHIFCFVIHQVANVDLSFCNEENFVDLIHFLDQNCSSRFKSWFQVGQDVQHEVTVAWIRPLVLETAV